MAQIEIKYWNISNLKPYAKNAKVHTGQQIQEIVNSITRFGFVNPILVDPDGDIIAGHGRHEAAKEILLEQVPVIVIAGLTADEKKALRLADNKIQQNAGWDTQILASELALLKGADFDMQGLGFSDSEMRRLLSEIEDVLPDAPISYIASLPSTQTDQNNESFGQERENSSVQNQPPVGYNDDCVFELVMTQENKISLLDALNKVKSNNLYDKLEDALMHIVRAYSHS